MQLDSTTRLISKNIWQDFTQPSVHPSWHFLLGLEIFSYKDQLTKIRIEKEPLRKK